MVYKIINRIYDILELMIVVPKIYLFGREVSIKYLNTISSRNIEKILKLLNAKIGENNNFKGSIYIDNAKTNLQNLEISNNCYIGKNISFDLVETISIESEVVIGMGATFLTHEDVGKRALSSFYKRKVAPIKLKESCWIGANSTILSGVTVGKMAVVAAGSVVIEDVPDYAVVAGIPAKVKKYIEV